MATGVLRGDRGVLQTEALGTREFTSEELAGAKRNARLDGSSAWRELYAKIEIDERKREGARDVIVVRKTPHSGEGEAETITVDAETYLPIRIEAATRSMLGTMVSVTDYRRVRQYSWR